jgi:hypothetical protein
MADIAQAHEHSERLLEWYWGHGYKREVGCRLPSAWLIDLYGQRDAAQALTAGDGPAARKSLAVWGPSASGKSMLLSGFLDARDDPGSALVWRPGESFRFKSEARFPGVPTFNPRKDSGTDASGCVTRFHLADEVDNPEHPVAIDFADRRQILQAVAAGYLTECRRELPDGQILQDVDEDFVRNELNPDGSGTPNQEAAEFVVDVVSAVDRLLPDGQERLGKLRRADDVWQRELRGALVADPVLSSSLERARSAGQKLLWDDRPKLNELADKLLQYRHKIAALTAGRPVLCSLAFAAHLVDIDTYGVLSGEPRYEAERVAELRATLLERTCYAVRGGQFLIGFDVGGERLFREPLEFGLFQGLVWELAVPLNARFFRDRAEDAILGILSRIEILDVPGVARAQKGRADTLVDLETKTLPFSVLLSRVLKRGKTATIINRYAEQLRIDGLLLLNEVKAPPAQPIQLVSGIQAIWDAADPEYKAASGMEPPVPLALCLTFMAVLLNENVHAGGINDMDLSGLEDQLRSLGEVAAPGVCRLYAMTYPHVPKGTLNPEAMKPEVLEALLRQRWVKERFRTDLEKGSLRATLFDPDGGVSYLLTAIEKDLAGSSRDTRISKRAIQIAQALTRLTEMAAPIRDHDGHRHSKALTDLAEQLRTTLERSSPEDELAVTMSSQLRRLLAFEATDFDPVPQRVNQDRQRLERYVKAQLERWVARPSARRVLTEMGVDEQDQTVILTAVRRTIDDNAVVSWVIERMDSVENDRTALHFRRYFAAKCSDVLIGTGNAPAQDNLDGVPLAARSLEKFNEWNARRRPEHSPHFEKVIEPAIRRLKAIAGAHIANDWRPQPGDDKIEELKAAWSGRNSEPQAAGTRGAA